MARKIKKHEYEYRHWYTKARKILANTYGVDANMFAGLLAATSARNQVKRNWRLAKQVYDSYKFDGSINLKGCMPCHIGNIHRALKGEPLSGSKVEAFRQNLIGNDSAVTIDIWMLRWLDSDKQSTTPKQYNIFVDWVRKEARNYNMEPAEYQAVCWQACRSDAGLSPKSFAGMFASENAQMKFWEN